MNRFLKLILLALCATTVFCFEKILIYPTTGPKMKFIGGFGIPVQELELESALVGYIFRTHFKLPASVKQLRTHDTINVHGGRNIDGYHQGNATKFDGDMIVDSAHVNKSRGEKERTMEDEPPHRPSGYRWAIYKGLEALGDRMGLSGRVCVLKSICETAEVPFHYHNGIYSEILHILLTPSASVDRLSTHSDNEYLHAEVLGKSGAPCDRVFKECKRSLLDQFSDIYEVSRGIFKRFNK